MPESSPRLAYVSTTVTEAEEVARVARLLARLGFVHAFGHVSTRAGEAMFITPTMPELGAVNGADILTMALEGELPEGGRHPEATRVPLEAPLHLALYRSRPDISAIVRVHAPSTAAWACRPDPPPLLHGFGGMAEPVGLWPGNDLISNAELAEDVARKVGSCSTALLRGNGGLAVGDSLPEAVVRAWCLEDRCSIALTLGDTGAPFTDQDLQHRRLWYANEAARLWRWLESVYGDDPARGV
jgi:HCOMODA/2-hydroxy-3-carboxy-muconic semialdehyde decarboxylase